MTGAGAVLAVVLLEWALGGVAAGAWTQSWSVVRRGHFRILAWSALGLGIMGVLANRAAVEGVDASVQPVLVGSFVGAVLLYLVVQYSRTDAPAVVVGTLAGVLGAAALLWTAGLIPAWPRYLAAAELLVGAMLLGAVTNGMLLGHWYLNQPGLKPWALQRLTELGLAAAALSLLTGVAAAGRLATASTSGAVLGIEGLGGSFGAFFFAIWLLLVAFTGIVVWMARRCVTIRSIQSATGLLYVALLTAGVAEFLVRYLMVNAV